MGSFQRSSMRRGADKWPHIRSHFKGKRQSRTHTVEGLDCLVSLAFHNAVDNRCCAIFYSLTELDMRHLVDFQLLHRLIVFSIELRMSKSCVLCAREKSGKS